MKNKQTSRTGQTSLMRYVAEASRLVLFIFIFLHFNTHIAAQEIRFEHITVNDGLAHSDAMDIVQGSDGFIWIATNNGVDRYDGYTLKHYRLPPSIPTGVTSNRVHVLFVDLNGMLWAGTENAGVYYFDFATDHFDRPDFSLKGSSQDRLAEELNNANVKSIAMDRHHRIWVATMNHGVFCLQIETHRSISSIQKVTLGLTGNPSYAATTVFANMNGRIWIGTLDRGLWVVESLNKDKGELYLAEEINYIPDKQIRVVRQEKNGDIWVASDHSVYHIGRGSSGGKNQVRKLPPISYDIQCLFSDSFGHLWVGSNSGLKMIENVESFLAKPASEKIHYYDPDHSEPSGINSNRIHQIMEDNFGNLWLAASDGGVNKIRLQAKGFHTITRKISKKNTLANSFVNAITCDDAQQHLWIGTRNGYSVFDQRSGTYVNFLTTPASEKANGIEVSAFCKVGNSMWIGTRYKGLYLAKTNKHQAPIAFEKLPGLLGWGQISVESIVCDKKGQVWVGTFAAGLMQFTKEGQYVRTYNLTNNALPSNEVNFLLYDSVHDVIWMSTRDQGVLKVQEHNGKLKVLSQFKHEPSDKNSLYVNFAWPLALDKKGNIWIGTIGGGLHKIEVRKGTEVLSRYQKLVPDSDVESILTDQKGNLWIAGTGLKKFTPQTGALVNFDVNDGLQSNSFKVGSAYMSATGTMYFGGPDGVTWFKPEEILPTPPPLVRITGMRVLNKNMEETNGHPGSSMVNRPFSEIDGVTIRADENDFLFEFVGLNYVNARKQSYAYMLQGYSENWIQLPDGQRTASFANLPAGDYLFRVKVSNGEGIWSLTPAAVRVKVMPPWWQTWWAYLFYFFTLLAALMWYRKIATSRLMLENKLSLEKLKSENEHKMAEMKANFFTGVSHELRTPLTLILGPMEELVSSFSESETMREKVLMMHRQAGKLLSLVNQLLNFRKAESGSTQLHAFRQDIIAVVLEVFSIFKIKADALDIKYHIDAPAQIVPVYFDPEKLEVIITNLLSNAFKYSSSGGQIQLTVKVVGSPEFDAVWIDQLLADHYLEISVLDTGKGIHPDDQERIFDPYYQASTTTSGIIGTGIGLALVKEFVKRHSGDIHVKSALEAGSTFSVRLPFGKTHLSVSEIAQKELWKESSDGHTEVVSKIPTREKQKKITSKILIVEDNTDLRIYLASVFRDNYQVFLSADGLSGWRMATEIMPDLILSDVNMPEMTGLDLCKKIKQDLKTTHIPVILLTARAAAVQELQGLETGADDYVIKPFNEEILKAKINNVLHNRERLQQYYHRQILLQPNEIAIADEEKLFLQKAMAIVEANLSVNDFNVQSLVNSMHMSQSVFYRRIKSITGQTVIEFIRDVRLKNAAQLLKNPHVRVSEVASMVGMEDVRNFRIFFQKRYDTLPSVYAKMHRHKAIPPQSDGRTAF